MKNLYESILSVDDIEKNQIQTVELVGILKKHIYAMSNIPATFENGVLCIDCSIQIDRFDELAKELRCTKFKINGKATIIAKTLDGLDVWVENAFIIRCDDIKNCNLHGTEISIYCYPSSKLKMVRNNVDTSFLKLRRLNEFVMMGNDFTKVRRLHLTEYGKKIDDKILAMNIVVKSSDGEYRTYPAPKNKPNPNLDPLKWLGLKRYFENVALFKLAPILKLDSYYLHFTTYRSHKFNEWDWMVHSLVNFNNGWQVAVLSGANHI